MTDDKNSKPSDVTVTAPENDRTDKNESSTPVDEKVVGVPDEGNSVTAADEPQNVAKADEELLYPDQPHGPQNPYKRAVTAFPEGYDEDSK